MQLPNEINKEIVSYLTARELLILCKVSKAFLSICRENSLWRPLVQQIFKFQESKEEDELWHNTFRRLAIRYKKYCTIID